MALPAYRSSGARVASITTATPLGGAGLAVNDVELLQVESADEAVTLSTANGFAEITGSPASAPNADLLIATRITVFWRRWDGVKGDPVIADAGNHVHAQRHAFSGVITSGDPQNITVGSAETVEDTSGSATGGTTTVDDCLVVLLAVSAKPDAADAPRYSAETNADLANIIEQQDGSTNIGNGGAMMMTTGERATAGAFGATTYTHTTLTYKAHLQVALKPVPPAAFPPPSRRREATLVRM